MSIEAMRELETLASVCPELNMANYTEDDVRRLNDWAIEMSLLADKIAVAIIQQAESEPVLFVSPEQARAVTGKNRVHYTPSDNSGRYLPVRATPAGLFVQPLYTRPAPGVPDGWSIEEKCGDIIVRKYGFGGYSARKNTESIAEAVLHELALDLLAASHAQKG